MFLSQDLTKYLDCLAETHTASLGLAKCPVLAHNDKKLVECFLAYRKAQELHESIQSAHSYEYIELCKRKWMNVYDMIVTNKGDK